MRQEIYLIVGFLAFAGGSFNAMAFYSSWYANAGRPGDKIGRLYLGNKPTLWGFYGIVFVNSFAFSVLPWEVAACGFAAQLFIGPLLLTLFRYRMQWLGPGFGLAGIIAAAVVFFDPSVMAK